jgi:hypothetical protein
MNKNILRKITFNGLGILSVFGLSFCFRVYQILQAELVPEKPVPSDEMNLLGGFTVLILFFVAIYHLILFMYALQKYAEDPEPLFMHSAYVVALILSGINIFTDYTILTDISHEYPYWDVSAYWMYLYICNAVHLAVVAFGLVKTWHTPPIRLAALFEQIRSGDDKLYRSMHQIGLMSAVIGLIGLVWALLVDLTEPYKTMWLFVVMIFALVPVGFMVVYWGIRNRKKPVRKWMDEKQFSDMAFGALSMSAFMLPLLVVFAVVSYLNVFLLNATAWLLFSFFFMLLIYFAVMVIKNNEKIIE